VVGFFSKNSWQKPPADVALLHEHMIHSIATAVGRGFGQNYGKLMKTKQIKPTGILVTGLIIGASVPNLQAQDNTFPNGKMVVADFNHDGRPDLAVVGPNGTNVSIFLNNNNGTFNAPLNSPARIHATRIAVGDLNGDGIPDLVVKNYDDMCALLGNGNGTFQAPKIINMPKGQAFYHVTAYGPLETATPALGDLNKDGKLDIAITGVDAKGNYFLDVLLGNGDGTFRTGSTLSLNPYLSPEDAVVIGDFTGDGKLDVVTADVLGGIDYPRAALHLFPGKGDGTLLPNVLTISNPAGAPAANSALMLAAADFNGDGQLDFVLTGGDLILMLNHGHGTNFTYTSLAATYSISAPIYNIAVGDFTGDAKPDILVSSRGSISALVGNGDGTFQKRTLLNSDDGYPMVLADFNGDGFLDAGVASSALTNVWTLLNLNTFPLLDSVRHQGGKFFGRVVGGPGQKQVIEVSSNLVSWAALTTNMGETGVFSFTNTTSWNQGYYRARIVP
jgi:hypothetical protein